MKNITPEILVARYITSATKGRKTSIKTRRIITLILIPIWLLGLVWGVTLSYKGAKAIFTYYEAKNNQSPELDKQLQEDVKKMEPLAQRMYHNPYLTLSYAPKDYESEMGKAKGEMFQLLALPTYFLLFFALPWVITRLVFWIVDAEKAKE
jgi:hypothetical protein